MKTIYFIINNNSTHKNIVNSGGGASELLFYLTAYKLSFIYNIIIINRYKTELIDNIQYVYADDITNPYIKNENSTIVVQRSFNILIDIHKRNPSNKYILWSHDYLNDNIPHLAGNYQLTEINDYFKTNNISVVSVSNFHKQNTHDIMPDINIIPIYNAVFPEYYPKQMTSEYDKNTIIFASNWGKGINKILRIGDEYSKINKEFKLVMLKPSYCDWQPDFTKYSFIKCIGNITNKDEYCELIQTALCVLTTSYPETFGCVFSEALHLGVPVVGDNSVKAGFHEIIHSEYMCNFNNPIEVITKIQELYDNRPSILLDECFYETAVIKEWTKIL